MKRLWLVLPLILLFVHPAAALKTRNCDALTGGTARALDYISVADCSNGDRALVVVDSAGDKRFYYFIFDASAVDAEQTATHPYTIRPDDYSTQGVWIEAIGMWVDLDTTLSINTLNILTQLNVYGILTGGYNHVPVSSYHNQTGCSLTGITPYGSYISAVSVSPRPMEDYPGLAYANQPGVTVYVPSGTGQGENFTAQAYGDTAQTGNTLFLYFYGADTVLCNQPIDAGVSGFMISGTSLQQSIQAICTGVSQWEVTTRGGPEIVGRRGPP